VEEMVGGVSYFAEKGIVSSSVFSVEPPKIYHQQKKSKSTPGAHFHYNAGKPLPGQILRNFANEVK